MMSSEEETDCFALYGASTDSKQQQLLKKQKRTRQRVDAGEPRNSYSSIPNFSSRPSFLAGAAAAAAAVAASTHGHSHQQQQAAQQQQSAAGLYGSLFSNSNSGSGSGLQLPSTVHSPPGGNSQQSQQQSQQQPQQPQQHSPGPTSSSGSSGAPSQGQPTAAAAATAAHASAFGFFGAQGFGPPNKMLNELFGRQVKQATDAGASPPEGAHAAGIDAAAAANAPALVGCEDPVSATAPELTQHMLREILQGRKLSALAASVQDQPVHNNNNNNNHNNNNNNTTTDLLKSQQLQQQRAADPVSPLGHLQQQQQQPNSDSARSAGNNNNSGGEDSADDGAPSAGNGRNSSAGNVTGLDAVMSADAEDSAEDAASAARAMEEAFAEAGMDPGTSLDPGSDCDQSLPSSPTGGPRSGGSAVSVKEEPLQDSMLLKRSPSHSPCPSLGGGLSVGAKTEASSPTTEIKRARVENIVSTMRSSPAPPQQQPMPIVNGCKKRKLYHPQQQTAHHVLQQSSYHHVVNDVAMLDQSDDDSDADSEDCVVKQKREEKDYLQDQLNKLYKQFAVMKQKYVELSNRMGPETSESPPPAPALGPHHQQSPHHHHHHHHSMRAHRAAVPGAALYNGLPSLPHDHAATAAMYQMVNQKFYLEQERYSVERMKQQQQQAAAAAQAAQAAAREREHQEQRERERELERQREQQQQQQQQQLHQQQLSPQPAPRLGKAHKPDPQQDQQQQQQQQQPSAGLSALRGAVELTNSLPSITETDLESLAEKLKSEISSSLSNVIDSLMSRFLQQKKFLSKQMEAAQAAAEQLNNLNKDLLLASQCLERKSPRTKVVDRGSTQQQQQQSQQPQPPPQQPAGLTPNGPRGPPSLNNGGGPPAVSQSREPREPQLAHPVGAFSPIGAGTTSSGSSASTPSAPSQQQQQQQPGHGPSGGPLAENNLNQLNQLPPGVRGPGGSLFQTPKPPSIYAMASMQQQQQAQQQREQYLRTAGSEDREARDAEQNEALSLVMTPKKKRSKVNIKVTDTRITPRVVSRILSTSQDSSQGPDSPPPSQPAHPRSYHGPPPGILPVSLPTSVAIPNPSLHESQVFSPYSPFFSPHPGHVPPPPGSGAAQHHHLPGASPPGADIRDSPPLAPHPPAMLHPALLHPAQHGNPADYGHLRIGDSNDRGSDCNSGEISYDGIQPTSSTLSPMHLRKAKLMFFWVRYPSSAVLKMYFPDIKFNKNNTAQLVKWFSNFREFYYIQMEKYARQAVQEGVKSVEDLMVGGDSEIYRVLNLHYNRNNHIEVPSNFRYVVEQTLKEFFKAIQGGKDTEQSWKKSIYKVISRLDDPVPEYFKSPNFLEQLE